MSLANEHSPEKPQRFAFEHYENYGFEAGLPYNLPRDFSLRTYLYLNSDVANYAKTQENPKNFSIWHFITHAQKEGRIYRLDLPDNFSAASYLSYNQDLTEHAKSDTLEERDQKLIIHYLRHGKGEGRPF